MKKYIFTLIALSMIFTATARKPKNTRTTEAAAREIAAADSLRLVASRQAALIDSLQNLVAVAEQRAFYPFCACHDGKFCRSNCRAAVIMRVNTYDSGFPVMQVFAEVFNLVGISVWCGHFYR